MARFLPEFDLPADDIAAWGLARRAQKFRKHQSVGEILRRAPSRSAVTLRRGKGRRHGFLLAPTRTLHEWIRCSATKRL